MQMGLLLPAALLFPLLWGWATYVVVSRLWPRPEPRETLDATPNAGGQGTQRSVRQELEVESVIHNFQI